MGLASSVRNGLGFAKRAIGYRSLSTAGLIQRNLPNVVVPLRPDGGRIVADALGLSLDPERHADYLPLLSLAQDLVREGGTFGVDEAGDPEYRIGNLRLTPGNRDDFHVLHEVFARRLYEMRDEREWFVVDVGMNVGYAALYYAGILGWETLGYEPFPKTFALAARNIAHNGLEARIDARCAGVAGANRRMEVDFNEASRSTNSLFGNLQPERKTVDTKVEVDVVDAAEVLAEALARANGRPVLVKLDCEGAEYDIVDRLVEKSLLCCVDAYVIEIHSFLPEHDGERILASMVAHGYLVKTLWTGVDATGILAVRSAQRNGR